MKSARRFTDSRLLAYATGRWRGLLVQATKSIFSHSSASTWTVFDLWLMFYLFSHVLFTRASHNALVKGMRENHFCFRLISFYRMRRKSDQGFFACYHFLFVFHTARLKFMNRKDIIKFAQQQCDFLSKLVFARYTYAPSHARTNINFFLSPSLGCCLRHTAHIDPNLPQNEQLKWLVFMLKS